MKMTFLQENTVFNRKLVKKEHKWHKKTVSPKKRETVKE
jgi:hypothetical protein